MPKDDTGADTLVTAANDDRDGAAGIAADDAGAGVLGRNIGQTAGGARGSGDASPEQEQPQGEIAADDAGATAAVQRAAGPSDAD